jgi:hypothetical protein
MEKHENNTEKHNRTISFRKMQQKESCISSTSNPRDLGKTAKSLAVWETHRGRQFGGEVNNFRVLVI